MHRSMGHVMATGVVLIALSGCGNLFTTNYFGNFDGPPSASELLSDYTNGGGTVDPADADDLVDALEAETAGNRFFDELSTRDRSELSTALESIYTSTDPTVSDATKQSAALLAADVAIRGTAAQDTINNVAAVLTDEDSGGSIDLDDASGLIGTIIPESAQNDPAAIDAILNQLTSAADAFTGLSATLADSDSDGDADPVEGVGLATVQQAAIAIGVSDLIDANGGGTAGTEAVRDAILNDTLSGLTTPDSPIGDDPADPTPLDLILQSAGISADLFSGST